MRLTRRGWGVSVVVIGTVLMAAGFGARGLNAVVAPGLVGLVAAVVQVWRVHRPVVTRDVPARGRRGESITVRLDVKSDTPVSARVDQQVESGLSVREAPMVTTVGAKPIRYSITLDHRGAWEVGPVRLRVRDVFGLIETSFTYQISDTVIVHPRIHRLAGDRGLAFVNRYETIGTNREQFDQVRVYQRGDPMRDIHWKSSAKQPGSEFVVKEFESAEGREVVWVAGIAERGCDDAMAVGVGSVSVALLGAGVHVGVLTPSGRIEPGTGHEQARRILDHLAIADAGVVDDHTAPDVVVSASGTGMRVRFADQDVGFDALTGGTGDTPNRGTGRSGLDQLAGVA